MNHLEQLSHINLEQVKTWIEKDGVETAAIYASQQIEHPDWQRAAGILAVMGIKVIDYREAVKKMRKQEIMSKQVSNFILKNADTLEKEIVRDRDFHFDYFSIQTLKRGYLLPLETPQYFFMRVACEIHCGHLQDAIETYHALSTFKIIHATPTLANAGTPEAQMSSCFLLSVGDSLFSILEVYKICGLISKHKGGIGHGISAIRNSKIGKNGKSKGIVAMLRCYNELVKYVDQTGTRKGAGTEFLSVWHTDLLRLLDLKKNFGSEEFRARDLNYCLWVQDLFMKRVVQGGKWSLFCPKLAPGLNDCYGQEFEQLYERYEKDDSIPKKTFDARTIYLSILRAQQQTSQPFMMSDDACNLKNNQNYLGHITNSNLCLEIIQWNSPIVEIEESLSHIDDFSDKDLENKLNSLSDKDFEIVSSHQVRSIGKKLKGLIASCNLGSVCIDEFVTRDGYDYVSLAKYTKMLVRNINRVIERNFYPVPFVKEGNDDYVPQGIGIMGTANAIAKMNFAYESKEAIHFIEKISACMYHAALQESRDVAKRTGKHYKGFRESPLGMGNFQFDLWNIEREKFLSYGLEKELYDAIPRFREVYKPIPVKEFGASESWEELMLSIQKYGIYNSVLLCGMPNASTAGLFGKNECHEPYHSNLYVREVGSGSFYIHNKEMVKDFEKLGLWSKKIINYLKKHDGSIQGISKFLNDERTKWLEEKYKIGFEISQKHMVDLVSLRGHYVCQSQSMNIRMANPDLLSLWNLHIYSWLSGQKTWMYYLHQKSIQEKQKVTLDSEPKGSWIWTPVVDWIKSWFWEKEEESEGKVCTRDDPNCTACQ